MVTRYSSSLQTDDVPSKHRIMSSPICTMGWVTSFNKHCTLSESVPVSLINLMFVPPPDATCSNIRCNISSGRSQMLHGRVRYASCLPPHSSLRTSTYCITLYFRGRKISRKVNLKYFREKIFSRIYCSRENFFPRKYLPAKISSRENILSRKYLPAKISSRENIFPRFFSVPKICRLVGVGYALYALSIIP